MQNLKDLIYDFISGLISRLTPVYDWQKAELDRSKAEYDANPASFLTWDEVQANILAKHEAG